jgi:hypothetical protein
MGTVTVEVARTGFAPQSQRVQLTERRPSRTLEFRLRASASDRAATSPTPPASTGRASLELASLPTGARAFVDDQPVGTTPLRLVDVAPGRKRIRFELPGHASWSTTVTVAQGEARRVAASLEPVR